MDSSRLPNGNVADQINRMRFFSYIIFARFFNLSLSLAMVILCHQTSISSMVEEYDFTCKKKGYIRMQNFQQNKGINS